jgi:hypothetical protein
MIAATTAGGSRGLASRYASSEMGAGFDTKSFLNPAKADIGIRSRKLVAQSRD